MLLTIISLFIVSCNGGSAKYNYETVPNDPLNTKIYTLSNGLKVYMTVNKDMPRIQANVAVKVGSKNDPSETTGLAHYFEHLMFKGSEKFGTSNYQAEKVLLDAIEKEFEHYRTLTDEAERSASYKIIDSLSYEASKYAIPNEYDKLMAAIGAQGTNAFTSYDMTVYVEDIPSNQIEAWAKIQADRFANNVIRGFHTELETVYEEKNMSLTSDGEKATDAALSTLFPNHPYGTQTVLGTQEHLKNPSITNIKNYYKKWYVPNNMAICLSGDFNPDEMVAIIEKYFGGMQPNNNLKRDTYGEQPELKEEVVKTVKGLEAPFVLLGWKLPAANSPEFTGLYILQSVLSNGSVGLIDINVNQAQKLLGGAYGGMWELADHSAYFIQARPKAGQSLEEVKNIVLEQIELLRKGDFDESLLKAIVNNLKKDMMTILENNEDRAYQYVSSFIYDIPWSDRVNFIDNLGKVTKEDIVALANKYFGNGYVVINKEQGKDLNELKISKPAITPILTNRDTSSAFLKEIQNMATHASPIEPVFVDFNKDMQKLQAKSNVEVLYKKNESNNLFNLYFIIETGTNDNKKLSTLTKYYNYLGTDSKQAQQIKKELYDLACDSRIIATEDRVYIMLSGLAENMEEALKIVEDKIANVKGDDVVLQNVKNDIAKARLNAKLNQGECFSRLRSYLSYGKDNPSTNILSGEELISITSDELLAELKSLLNKEQYVMYYGPDSGEKVVEIFNKYHNIPEKLEPLNKEDKFVKLQTLENKVFIAPYDAKQIYLTSYSNTGDKLKVEDSPIINMYNEYFGGGMNSIVFQEMREARGLAYSAVARYVEPSKVNDTYYFMNFIATQNDKMMDALTAFDDIINNMPTAQGAFNIAKENILANVRTDRIIKDNVLWYYVNMKKKGISTDPRADLFNKVKGYTLQDVIDFQTKTIKNRTYSIGILGDEKDLNIKELSSGKYGEVVRLSLKDIFGY